MIQDLMALIHEKQRLGCNARLRLEYLTLTEEEVNQIINKYIKIDNDTK